ncbi:MAG: cobaltochelatase subunit CobN, partial [Gammaproteobacteria bacterium]|nr:cobaltochelatase subunit CobN [Gammaproteobacteria bacterium]
MAIIFSGQLMLSRYLLLSSIFFLSTFPVSAATLFAVVSERSATEIASGAREFTRHHPGHTLIFRTPSQLSELTDKQVIQFIETADAIMIGAVFGDSVTRIERLLKTAPIKKDVPVFATNSDRRLTRLSRLNNKNVFTAIDDHDLRALTTSPAINIDYQQHVNKLSKQYPEQKLWLQARTYWQGRGSQNMAGLIAWLLHHQDKNIKVAEPQPQAAIRYYQDGQVIKAAQLKLSNDLPLAVILDHNTGDRAGDRELLDTICSQAENLNMQCIAILARWGEASMQAIKTLTDMIKPVKAGIMVSLQDFAIGGGEHRKKVTGLLTQLNIPVIKGIRLTDRTTEEWQLSTDGIPWDGVHYRVAMPELQGISQPMILATASTPYVDNLTGLKLSPSRPVLRQVTQLTARMHNWVKLRHKNNAKKRVALIYYNHPPGRHNIGADNLDVPASLWQILNQLKQAGYHTGQLPESQEALLELIQQRGINLPNDQAALAEMSENITSLSPDKYNKWFKTLSPRVQDEMLYGPLGYLQSGIFNAVKMNKHDIGQTLLQHVGGDIDHLLEGINHPARDRALDLFKQFKQQANALLKGNDTKDKITRLTHALHATGIEGIRGWGKAPGNVMVFNNKLLVPGIQLGNIFIGPQPPRGWEVNEELLHANLSFPPPHQYLGFYYWIKHEFKADALVHLGRHSTYEFLPQRRVGLTEDDYPSLIAADIPGIYPYIVDGVGEGIQAKRRGLAVIIDHLTPPLNVTPLYDDLLSLRQLVESFESSQEKSPARHRAVKNIRDMIDKMKLRSELETIMNDELQVRGIGFEQVDDEMLVHEVSHYLTQMQEQFMPMGLHVFGKDWEQPAIEMMLNSINQPGNKT